VLSSLSEEIKMRLSVGEEKIEELPPLATFLVAELTGPFHEAGVALAGE